MDEPGEISLSPEEVPEPGVEITASLADGDGTISGVTWQWQRSEDGEAEEPVWTNISGATSDSYTPDETDDVISGGDNDGEGYYLRATVSYTDGEDGGKSAMAIPGQVGTANVRPQFPDTETGQRSVDENSRSGTNIGEPVEAEDQENNRLVYSLTGTDAESFTIVSSTGQLRVREPLDYESSKSMYYVTVNVHDRRDAAGASSTYIDDDLNVTITVENVEEPGTVTLTSPTGRVQATVPVAAALSDPDIPTGTINWQWARSSNRSSWPDNPDPDIPGATSAEYIPLDEDEGYYLRATASYTDGHVTDGNDPNEVDTAEAVSSRVGEPPPTNSAPVFLDAEDGQREVRENAAANTAVGVPVAATDHNDDTLKYFLSGSDTASFTIVENTGQVRVKQDAKLDYEGKRTYRLTVQVTDGADEIDELDDDSIDDTISVTVTVTDVNEPPAITGEAEREFRENGTSSVATYSARDPEGDTFTWSLGGADASSFVITDRGQLYFNEPPSYEDGDTYQVTVTATDDDETRPLSASLNVTITVTDLEERGTVTIFPVRGWVTAATETEPETRTRFTATLEEGDGIAGSVSWQWPSGNTMVGATSSNYIATSSYIATEDDVNQYLKVTATYREVRSMQDDPDKTVTAVLRTRIGDTRPEMNAQPEFTLPKSDESREGRFDTRTIRSGSVVGRNIGSRVSARDDDGDVLTYMLRGRGADKFEIDPETGQIRTKAALGYLDQDTYTLSVSVHDGFDAIYRPSKSIDDTISIIITVLPPPPQPRRSVTRTTTDDDGTPNRPAEFSDGETTNRAVVHTAEPGANVGRPVAASDPDGDSLTYTLGGIDGESFDIDSTTGQLRTKAALDIETKSSYTVTVSVTDGKNAGGGTYIALDDTITVSIRVTAVELSEIAKTYDADEDGLISLDEAMAAVSDYFDGIITLDEALEVIALYFESPATGTRGQSGNG